MAYYSTMKISTNEIAGAIAMEILHDLRLNHLSFEGFPSIDVSDLDKDEFTTTISCGLNKEHKVSFVLSKENGVSVENNFKNEKRTGDYLFKIVQKSLANLEHKAEASLYHR